PRIDDPAQAAPRRRTHRRPLAGAGRPGLCAAAHGPRGDRRDDPPRRPEHRGGGQGGRFRLPRQSRPGKGRGAGGRVHPAASARAHPGMPSRMKRAVLSALAAAIVLAALPLAIDSFGLHVLTICLYYTILAASWNLLAGMTGQFSLAHQAFAAIGAYGSGLLAVRYHWPLWLSMPAGVALA